jgi:hypothetical protein
MSDATPLVLLLVYALAAARLTGLATGTDEVFAPQVLWVVEKINPAKLDRGWRFKVAYMITCMWCASFWIGLLLVAPIAYWYPAEPWALIPALALAFSQVTGMTSEWGRS